MTKIDNITNSFITNPLVCVVIALFVLLIILEIIRLLNPGFSVGAEIKGHFGSLNGGMRIEGFEDSSIGQKEYFKCKKKYCPPGKICDDDCDIDSNR